VEEKLRDLVEEGTPKLATTVYDQLLGPAFPPDELDDRADFLRAITTGRVAGLALVADDQPLGAVIGYSYPRANLTLVGYITVAPAFRNAGRGGRLLDAAREQWSRHKWGRVALAELEVPGDLQSGTDACRRLAFYSRRGALAVDGPYFQPRLRPTSLRVPNMMLTVLWGEEPVVRDRRICSHCLVHFLYDYFAECEGVDALAGDAAVQHLLTTYAADEHVTLVPLKPFP
jgi:GNAT superfamily N-acetyltransferase